MQRLGLTLLVFALVIGVTGSASAGQAQDEAAVRAFRRMPNSEHPCSPKMGPSGPHREWPVHLLGISRLSAQNKSADGELPNFQVRMPGAEYEGNDPYGFMSLAQVIEYFDDYVKRFRLPVHCGVEAFSVEQMGPSYLVRTSEGNYIAENVVIATGLYQSPKIPSYSAEIPDAILQMHSMHYRNPATLPEGAVLVVGTGQSGAQIAQELHQSGRKVYLSIGSAGRVPRRYRGKDINDWFTRIGMFDTKVEELKSPKDKFHAHPQISGKNGGQSLNLHKFARDGVILLGHVHDAHDGHLILAPDLKETLAKSTSSRSMRSRRSTTTSPAWA